MLKGVQKGFVSNKATADFYTGIGNILRLFFPRPVFGGFWPFLLFVVRRDDAKMSALMHSLSIMSSAFLCLTVSKQHQMSYECTFCIFCADRTST